MGELRGGGGGEGSPAAIRVAVGAGVAVLAGVHPELPTAPPPRAGTAGWVVGEEEAEEDPADRAARLAFLAALLRAAGVVVPPAGVGGT